MKRFGWFLLAAVLLGAAIFASHRSSPAHLADPDRLYHFALSREMAGKFVLRAVPQVEDLGWNEYFPDKEFLFHQLTALGYRIGSDEGVIYLVLACTVLAAWLLFTYGTTLLPAPLSLLALVLTFSWPIFFFRMQLVRPHVLAVVFFILLQIGILRERRWLVFTAAALFALSYHAFYLPLICLALAAAVAWLRKPTSRRDAWTVVAAGVAGVFLGVLVNPHFPSNVVSAWEISKIPSLMQSELKLSRFGSELYPLSSTEFLQYLWWPMALVAAGLVAAGSAFDQWRKKEEHDWRLFYLVPVSVFFLGLCFESRRASEYLVPLATLLSFHLFAAYQRWLGAAALIPLAAVLGINLLKEQREAVSLSVSPKLEERRTLALAVPPGENKIFNCEWESTPSLYYYRPELRFIDILDPSLLYFQRRDAFLARDSLRLGRRADAHGLVKGPFKASYVTCIDPEVRSQFELDPGFRRLHPREDGSAGRGGPVHSLFEVKKDPVKEFATEFFFRNLPQATPGNFLELQPATAGGVEQAVSAPTTYLDLGAREKGGEARCALVRPAPEEIERLAGATLVGLGGGRNLRLWWNGKPLYAPVAAHARSLSVQVLVPLPRPLQPVDSLEVMVCSSREAAFWGLSLSLWSDAALKKACDWKKSGLAPEKKGKAWSFKGTQAETCLGPIAAPASGRNH